MTVTVFYQFVEQVLTGSAVCGSTGRRLQLMKEAVLETNNNNNNNNNSNNDDDIYEKRRTSFDRCNSKSKKDKKKNSKCSSRLGVCLAYLCPTLVAILCYVNSLWGDLVHDDVMAIRNNPDVRPDTPVWNLVSNDFWGKSMEDIDSHKSYRPLTVLSFRLNYVYGEFDPFGYHVVNVCLHAAATLLLVRLARWLWQTPHLAGLAGVLFAVHPVHTEAVAGIVGRADVLACVLFLLTLLTYIRVCEKTTCGALQTTVLLTLTSVLATAALLVKEHAIAVLGVCLLLDVCCIAKPLSHGLTGRQKTRCAVRWFVLLLTACVLLAMRLGMLHGKLPAFSNQDNPAAFSDSILTRWLTHLHVYSLNVWLLLVPVTLSYDWQMGSVPLVESLLDLRNAATLAFLVFFLALAAVSIRLALQQKVSSIHRRPVIVGAVLLVIPFLPASNIFFTVGFVLAERVLYIPSAGFIILAVHGLGCLLARWPGRRRHLLAAFYTWCLLLAGRTVVRNQVWQSREILFRSGVQTFGHNAKMHYNYANWLKDVGSVTYAVEHYKTAIRLWPTYASAHNNVGTIIFNNTEAMEHYRRALDIQPSHAKAWFNLAHAFSKEGRLEEGLQALEQSNKHGPNNADTCSSLAVHHEKLGHTEQAEVYYRKAVEMDTDDLMPYSKLADILLARGDLQEALAVAGKALSTEPHHLPNLKAATAVLLKQGKASQAAKLYMRAVSMKHDSTTLDAAGVFFFNLGRKQEALQLFQRALAKKPQDPTKQLHYSQALSATGQLEEAEKVIHKVLKKQPQRADAMRQLASIYGELKHHEHAIQVLELAARHSRDQATHAGIFFDMGKNFRDLKMMHNASLCFQKVVELQPDLAEAHHNLGVIYHMQGDYKNAVQHYAVVQRLSPDDPVLRDNLDKLHKAMQQNEELKTGAFHGNTQSFSGAIRGHGPVAGTSLGGEEVEEVGEKEENGRIPAGRSKRRPVKRDTDSDTSNPSGGHRNVISGEHLDSQSSSSSSSSESRGGGGGGGDVIMLHSSLRLDPSVNSSRVVSPRGGPTLLGRYSTPLYWWPWGGGAGQCPATFPLPHHSFFKWTPGQTYLPFHSQGVATRTPLT